MLAPKVTQASPAHPLRQHLWRVLLLWLLVGAAYSNSWHAGLVFDSAPIIQDDPRVHVATWSNVHEIFTGDYWYRNNGAGLYRPLTTLSYLVNYAVLGSGTRPEGYHAVNLAIHMANVLLVYVLGLVILGDLPWAFALAALWGVHPLLTEAVTNVVGRADLLMAFGVIAGLLCYIRASADGKRAVWWIVPMVLAQAVALFAKESGVVLPVLILLYDLTFGKPDGWSRRLPVYASLALPIAVFFYLRGGVPSHLTIPFFENPLSAAGFWTARLTAIKAIGELAWLFPWPVHLSADYSFNAVPLFGWRLDLEDLKAVLSLLLCAGAVILAVLWRRSQRAVAWFLGFFFIAIAPTANLAMLIGSIKAERFFYLGSIGLAGVAIVALRTLSVRWQKPAWILTAVVCLLFAMRTHARNVDWQSEESLWASAVEVVPSAARPHNNLGNALLKVPGRLPQAIAEFQTALRILPNYADAHYNLGIALAQSRGHLPEAIAEYRAALQTDPDSAKVHINLGTALAQMPGQTEAAVAELKTAVRLQPDSAEAHYDLGNALLQLARRVPDAIAEYRAALQIDPDYAPAHNNLGSILSAMPGRLTDAIVEYRSALRSDANYAKAHNNLANALVRVPGGVPEAIAEYQAALRIQPDFADAHYNLGIAYARMPERRPQAIAELQTAQRLDPNPDTQRALDWLSSH